MSNETGTHLGEESRPVSVSFLQVLYNVGIIPAREQYRDINKGVVRLGSSPRAPHGARPPSLATRRTTSAFQSTRPARGATVNSYVSMNRYNFIYTIGENDDRETCRSQKTATFRVSFCANLQGLSHR